MTAKHMFGDNNGLDEKLLLYSGDSSAVDDRSDEEKSYAGTVKMLSTFITGKFALVVNSQSEGCFLMVRLSFSVVSMWKLLSAV